MKTTQRKNNRKRERAEKGTGLSLEPTGAVASTANVEDESERAKTLHSDADGQLQLLHVDEFAFDEMNLVEIPFCLLKKQSTAKRRIALSPSGHEYLETSGESLPSALAEPVVLGLMWLTQEANGFQDRVVRFPLRKLIEDYMHPDRYNRYRVSGAYMDRVEDELHRIAATRMRSTHWYDRARGEHVDIDASIIDYIKTVQRGGRNAPKVMEVAWGTMLFESVRARYTKGLDLETYLHIQNPLEARLFRWLDRQFHGDRRRVVVKSCQDFARYKMLMTGQKIDAGGRRASTYITRKIGAAIEQLDGHGFSVRMTVDKAKPDHEFIFERLKAKTANEVVEDDSAGNLVREFQHWFHGMPRDAKKRRIAERDRSIAGRWASDYGHEQATWMIRRCRELHERGRNARERIGLFAGLRFYEAMAAADYERWKNTQDGQLDLLSETEDLEFAEAYFANHQYADAIIAAKTRLDRGPSPRAEEILRLSEQARAAATG